MKKCLIAAAILLISLHQPVFAQDEVAPGTIAELARKTSSSEFQNWMFALGALISATAGVLLVSWDPGADAHSH